jgi:hypothetical protein
MVRPPINTLTAPVVAIDIDGSTGEYHEHFRRFAEQYLGKELPLDWDLGFKGSFHRALHISKKTYRDIKLAYRSGGMKRSMPVRPGAAALCDGVRKMGAQVWICTTRPYLRLDNIDPDTREWLRRNRIHWDHLIYGEAKYRDLVANVTGSRIVGVYDDLPEQVESARALGLRAIIADGPHNAWFPTPERTWRVFDCFEALDVLELMIKEWHEGEKK